MAQLKLLMTSSPMTLNLAQGSVTFSFTPEAAQELNQSLTRLMQSLKAAAAQPTSGVKKPRPQPAMEYRYTGQVFLEVFCNPNIYPSPFAAKVLVTLRDERIRLTTEAELTRLLEDLGQYLEQVS